MAFGEIDNSVCREAYRLVHGNRGSDYGHPWDDFSKTAGIWTAMFGGMLQPGAKFEPEHVAMAMISVKLSRQMNKPKRDSMVDIAGYAETCQMCVDRREETKNVVD